MTEIKKVGRREAERLRERDTDPASGGGGHNLKVDELEDDE